MVEFQLMKFVVLGCWMELRRIVPTRYGSDFHTESPTLQKLTMLFRLSFVMLRDSHRLQNSNIKHRNSVHY